MKKNMNNTWLIPMDYATCNYSKLEEEWNNNKKIMWQVPGTPDFRNGEWRIKDNSMAQDIKSGDAIYFYITNLPSESKTNLSRVMLRGIVGDAPFPIKKSDVFMGSDDESMIIGFSIKNITTLCKEHLEDNSYLSYEHLMTIDNDFKHPQGKRWPDQRIKNNLSDKIIKIFDESFKTNLYNNDFETLINHFSKKCFFCDKYGNRNEHKTFVGRNGLDYFEYHHFIPQHMAKENIELKQIIDSPTNGLYLCSNCHNKIHYGRAEDIREMIRIILKDDSIMTMIKEYNFAESIDKEMYEWFFDAYKVS